MDWDKSKSDGMRGLQLDAVARKDLEGYLALLTDDYVALPPNRPMIVGKEGMREFLVEFMRDWSYREVPTTLKTMTFGGYVLAWGTYRGEIKPAADAKYAEVDGKWACLLKLDSSGEQAKFALQIWNMDK